nr:major histocompatibility complex class I-related gene protein isoform X5 [Syngnathus scovelli]
MKIFRLVLALVLQGVQDTSAERHSLKYFLTATSGVNNFPDFVGTAEVDGVWVGYCDSDIQSVKTIQGLKLQPARDFPEHLIWYNFWCSNDQRVYRKYLKDLSQRLNQSGGSHVLQRMCGCEIDDDSDEVVGYNQFGYDGEDFIVLDLETLMWTAPSPQAFTTKLIWDTEKERMEHIRDHYKVTCPEWLKIFVDYGKSVLQRKELPSMALLQKTPTSMVCCHATGFYPRLAMMFWRRGGEELHEHIEHGELLPNHDGTFQMSVNLNVSAVPLAEWPEYECVFQFGGVKEQLVIKLDQDAIQSNWIPPQKVPAGVVIGGMVGLLLSLLAAAAVGCYIWKRNADGEFQAVDGEC